MVECSCHSHPQQSSHGRQPRRVWPLATKQVPSANRQGLGPAPHGKEWIVTVPRLDYRLIPAAEPSSPFPPLRPTTMAVLRVQSQRAVARMNTLPTGGGRHHHCAAPLQNVCRHRAQRFVCRQGAVAGQPRDRSHLGVRYVLEGSMRRRETRLGSTCRSSTRRSDPIVGRQFEGEHTGLFDFQDRITEAVVGLVEPKVRKPRDSVHEGDRRAVGYVRSLPVGAAPVPRSVTSDQFRQFACFKVP